MFKTLQYFTQILYSILRYLICVCVCVCVCVRDSVGGKYTRAIIQAYLKKPLRSEL